MRWFDWMVGMQLARRSSIAFMVFSSLGCTAPASTPTGTSTGGDGSSSSASSGNSDIGTSSGEPEPTTSSSTQTDDSSGVIDPTGDGTTGGGCYTEPCVDECDDHDVTIETLPVAHATALAFIDADGDEAQELLAATWQGGLLLLPAAGAGPEEQLLPGANVGAIASGDLDGDGDEDIAAAVEDGVVLLLNDGTGGFDPGPTIDGVYGYLGIADLDGEGEIDILVYGSVDTAPRILFGQPGLEYTAGEPFVFAHPEVASVGVAIGQFDGVGGDDVAFPDGDLVSWWFADDSPGGAADTSRRGLPGVLTGADFDGDGLEDAVRISEVESFVQAVQGYRGGELEPMQEWRVDSPEPGADDQWFGEASAGDFDFDGDGHDDLLLSYDGWIHIRYGAPDDGDDTFGCIATYELGGGYLDSPTFGDFDGDGRDDLVWGGNAIHWLRRS
jgi:hypothetical protein